MRAIIPDDNFQKSSPPSLPRRHRNPSQGAKNDGDAHASPLPVADGRSAAAWLPLLRQAEGRWPFVLRVSRSSWFSAR